MQRKVKAYIEEHHLLSSGQPVIVGLSGGADSVALLKVLCDLGYHCFAAHCNFHLRDEESDRDEAFACAFSESMDIPFYKTDFETLRYAREKRLSVEMAARELRYDWFETLRVELGAQAIAIAHHEQDNVETVLLNLVRGTGIKGLIGMQPRNGYVVRPLLTVKKQEILDWLCLNHLDYVTDSSNLSDTFTRNFLRLDIVPLLEKINPSVSEAIVRMAENLTDAELLYRYALKGLLEEIREEGEGFRIESIQHAPAPKTVLYELLQPYGFNRSVVQNIYQSFAEESGKVFYSATHRLLKDRDRLLLASLTGDEEKDKEYRIYPEDKEICCSVKLFLRREVLIKGNEICKDKRVATLDWNKLRFPLTLRHWREGDWFIPFGMKGRKKISDYFTNNKFNLFEKQRVWLLCSGENIVWVVGERIDHRFCVDKNTKEILIIHFFEE
ncbi:MAG: tRNA lysidine(34) synthetase TilS [Massilibacteroides sp.]|nr:tRNA lysidine(34) synthetase TilS [Massilibacteroides sp.]